MWKKILTLVFFLGITIISGCVSRESEPTYSDGTPISSDIEKIEKPLMIEDTYANCKSGMYTKTYELDGYTYRIFWLGDGYQEGGLVVINLEEQEARIKYYQDNSKSISY